MDKLLFHKQLEELKLYAQTAELKTALTNVNNLWEAYQATFRRKLLKENVASLLDISQEMLAACELVLKEINVTANTPEIAKINSAANLRTKTEQIFLFCLAERWAEIKYKKELSVIFLDYENGLTLFRSNTDNTPEISALLDSVERYYKRLKSYEQALDEVDIYALFMVRNVLLLETEKLTKSSAKVTLF